MGEAAGIASKLAINSNCAYKDINVNELRNNITRSGGMVDINETK